MISAVLNYTKRANEQQMAFVKNSSVAYEMDDPGGGDSSSVLASSVVALGLPSFARRPPSSLRLAVQAQDAEIDMRNRAIEAMKEKFRNDLLKNDKTLSDAALSVRTRERKILHLNDQVPHGHGERRWKQPPTLAVCTPFSFN